MKQYKVFLLIAASFLLVTSCANQTTKEDSTKTFNHQSGEYLEINGAKIYYEETGNKKAPVVLILHGGFQSMEDMNSIVSYLSNDFRIIGIDSRGHGKSTMGNESLTYERLQIDAETILKHLGVDTVSIIGFSDGGTVAYRMAANHTVKVDKLITIGGTWSLKDVLSTESSTSEITPEAVKKYCFDSYQRLNPEPDFNLFVKLTVGMWTDKTKAGHPDKSVKNITSPTLIIKGDSDFFISLESIVELKSILGNASFLDVPFAEHLVYEEQKDICEIAIKQFLLNTGK